MRQLEITGPRTVQWREAPAPVLGGDGEALVRPLAVALCDLDAVFLSGAIPIAEPFPFGHECVAEVLEVGDTVKTVVPGDRVVVPFQISCGTCAACAAGRTASCRTVPRGSAYGMRPLGGDWGGALSDVLRVPYADAMLVALPEGVEPTQLASVADNVADGYRAVAGPLAAAPGEEVLIVGGWARSIGLYAAACALALDASRVVYADTDEGRLERAAALGAETVAVAEWPKKLGRFPITVDASGDHAGLHAALRSTAPDGTCTSVAIYFEPETPVPLLELYTRGCTLHTGRVHARAVIPDVLALVAAGRLDPALVTSAVVAFDDAPAALAEPPTKLILVA
ncbi:alcohol dehydrogenase catalytic domain-containing protein [Solirubrobacter ginsenosidimutans]|uniref:Alcohol dehydrogenase catalytic domain-containing protein n=1 Tax=Solirubrobacter ginsenosidimutans TaxID=490573 RepID=A0A9X3MSD4_9ACTN|nr:alcohol dehydrogenase catalytic domain-containing protein [Solirubrobacter ginsenosidimutans]MDA0161665.1 alcohol dehydrogenase catalytic domain-containing protein [Solirubrobacter ginsenosidimutans]